MSPDGKTHNQIDHSPVERRRHSNILDVPSYRAADCDTDHSLVVAKVRERLAVNKQRSHNLNKLNEVEGKEHIVLRSQIGLQLWEIWTKRWKLIVPGK
jgi:hypothetical protein